MKLQYEEKSLIQLNGKETKAKLIKKLIEGKANYDGSLEDTEWYYRGDSKSTLLQKVKIYNANKVAGGDGNISMWDNKEAHSHKIKLDCKLKKWLLTYGLNEENISQKISAKKGKLLSKKWKDYINSEHNGFIGHTSAEMKKALNMMKELYISISHELGVELKK